MNRRKMWRVGLLALLAQLALAQTDTAKITGRITDPSGAVVQGCKITVIHVDKGTKREATSNESGYYTVPFLPLGGYRVTVQKEGFQPVSKSGITLHVNQTARIDFELTVGELQQQIEVTAAPVLLQSETSEVGHIVTNKRITELPASGRDYLMFARLIPGAIPSRTGGIPAAKGVSRSVHVGGARDTSVSFLLDGIDTNAVSFQVPSVTPSIDAIEEFKVMGNAYSAEFGRGSTQILTSLKSGTNDVHGSLFEFLRNDKFAARYFFEPEKVAPLKLNQFGLTLGGPVLVPGIYDGKNRTFFFVNYESRRTRTAGTGFAFVPTPEQLDGDFSAPGNPTILDPLTKQPFSENKIPASRFSERGRLIADLYPAPNFTGLAGRNYADDPAQKNDNNQGNIRIDHRLSEKDLFFARYSILDAFGTAYGVIAPSGEVDDIRGQNVALNWVRASNPNLLNEVRGGFNRSKFLTVPAGSFGENPARDYFGFTNTTENYATAYGLPEFKFAGGYSALGHGSASPTNGITQTVQLVDSFTYLRAGHSMKAGFDFRHTRVTQVVGAYDRGSFQFLGRFTGSPIGDLLLGHPYVGIAASGDQAGHFYNELYALYLQDDWKISSRLTLNLGIRYEYATPYREKLNRMTVLDETYPGGRLLLAGTSKVLVPGEGIVDTGSVQVPKTIFDPDRNNWAPRIGFAYRALAKTVFRGAYGIFYDVQEANEALLMRANPPFFAVQALISNPRQPTLQLDEMFPAYQAAYPVGALTVGAVDRYSRAPYMQQWNFNIQHSIAPNLVAEVGYMGSKGTHLLRRSNYQQGPNILAKDPANPTPLAQRVQFPNFSPTLIVGTDNSGSSTHHGLVAKLERIFQNGLTFLASYTFSKTIDDASSSANFGNTPSNPQCACDFEAEKSLSAFHIQQRMVFSYTYELPFGSNKRFLRCKGVAGKIVSGWQINGVTALQTGPAFTINTTGDNANIGTGAGSANNQRPNLVGDPYQGIDQSKPVQQRGVDADTYYFNKSAFVVPPAYTLGNLGRNTLIAPGSQNWDFSIFKNTAVLETMNLQFRAEFFNVFNHPNFAVPGRYVGTPTFGVITWADAPRTIQFGLKLIF